MRALAVFIGVGAAIAWLMVATVLPEFLQAVTASARPDAPLFTGLRARVLQSDVINYSLVALVATIGAALLWRAGRPDAGTPPSPQGWTPSANPPYAPAGTHAPLRLRHCPNCAAAVNSSDRFCGQCGASLVSNPPAPPPPGSPARSDGGSEWLTNAQVARKCPRCGTPDSLLAGKCTKCGYDRLASERSKVLRRCPHCDELHEFKAGACQGCGYQDPALGAPPLMKDRG